MPIYNPILTSLDETETRRYAGLAGHGNFPAERISMACAEALILSLVRGTWQLYAYDAEEGVILADPPVPLNSQELHNHLSAAIHVAVMAVTIGESLEEAVSAAFTAGKYADAYLLDAAGTTAVEAAADQVNQAINQYAARLGCTTTRRFSPGYGKWDIRCQPQILTLAEAHHIGLETTSTCMLTPRKSVTAVIGFVPLAATSLPPSLQQEAGNCLHCSLPQCHARKEP